MMSNLAYGSRAQDLPRSLVRLVKAKEPAAGLIWTGREGVVLLDREQHLAHTRRTVERLPVNRDGTIAWSQTQNLLLWSREEEDLDLVQVIREFASRSSTLILEWGNSVIPTVAVQSHVLAENASDIVTAFPEFWIYSDLDDVLLERTFAGQVTVARMSAAARPQDV